MKEYGERLDAERRRKRDAILEILFQEAANGRCYTANQFAEGFEGKTRARWRAHHPRAAIGLGDPEYIKYFRNAADYGLPSCGRTSSATCVWKAWRCRWPSDRLIQTPGRS